MLSRACHYHFVFVSDAAARERTITYRMQIRAFDRTFCSVRCNYRANQQCTHCGHNRLLLYACVRVCVEQDAICEREMICALGAAAKAASLFPLPAWPDIQGAKMNWNLVAQQLSWDWNNSLNVGFLLRKINFGMENLAILWYFFSLKSINFSRIATYCLTHPKLSLLWVRQHLLGFFNCWFLN